MTHDFASFSNEQLNDKVAAFISKFKSVIERAAAQVGLDHFFYDEVVVELACKFSLGKIQYDPSMGVGEEAYIYSIAHNAAVNLKRKNNKWDGNVSIDEDGTFDPIGTHIYSNFESGFETDDSLFIFFEALKRLSKEFNHTSVEIFVRSYLRKEHYILLANEYHQNPTTVASKKSRIFKRFLAVLNQIRYEEDNGCFVKSTNSIDYLKPYLGDLECSLAA